MHRFMRAAGHADYDSLYRWSIDDIGGFWETVHRYCGVRFSKPARVPLLDAGDMMHAGWFAGSELNYAEHLLRARGARGAIVFVREDGLRREMTRDELRAAVAAAAAGLRAAGVGKGDRVAGFMPNCAETIVAALAASSIGAVWSSCSPDFGVDGVLDRFGQIGPKLLFATNGYIYNGKRIETLDTVRRITAAIAGLENTVIVPFLADAPAGAGEFVQWQDFGIIGQPLETVPVPFDHPLYILYSSGTTGVPKCIVHSHGGVLLKHLCELGLHIDVADKDRVFYFTTCGWMMWNWLLSGLALGATLILYDGAPFRDDGAILWRLAEQEGVTVFGTSAKYLAALEKSGLRPRDSFDLGSIRTLLSTGSPLAPEGFDYVYDAIGTELQLGSIAGGTDLLGCFAIANPLLPVRRGELQCRALGMAVQVFNDEGRQVVDQKGELVCVRPFPSTPVCFWNDPGDARYRAAYFERFPGIWAHGDFAELKSTGGMVIYGRSDAVLNPGGVRIGTAEIYRQVEKLDEVIESIAVSQDWQGDVRVVLFVVLRPGHELDEDLRTRIRAVIRQGATPRHVPAKIIAVPEIPRTRSGKIVELAVRAAIHGQPVKNTEALANPSALKHFRDLPELARD